MPSPLNQMSPEKFALDANNRYLQTYAVRENNAYIFLINYSFDGFSSMIDHTWTAPSGDIFSINVLGGGFTFNGDPFSALDADKKRTFMRYLSKFIGECLKNYNLTYNF